MKGVFCWPWSHRWSKWVATSTLKLLAADRVVGYYIVQHRMCSVCDRLQSRRVQE